MYSPFHSIALTIHSALGFYSPYLSKDELISECILLCSQQLPHDHTAENVTFYLRVQHQASLHYICNEHSRWRVSDLLMFGTTTAHRQSAKMNLVSAVADYFRPCLRQTVFTCLIAIGDSSTTLSAFTRNIHALN